MYECMQCKMLNVATRTTKYAQHPSIAFYFLLHLGRRHPPKSNIRGAVAPLPPSAAAPGGGGGGKNNSRVGTCIMLIYWWERKEV